MKKNDSEILKELLADTTMKVDPKWCDSMTRKFPCFTLPALLELERNTDTDDERHRRLAHRVAVNSASTDALYRAVEPLGTSMQGFYPPEERHTPSTTEDIIDTFISNYGTDSDSETALLEKLIFNPVPDYAQLLSEEEERSLPQSAPDDDSPEGRINSFILKSREQHGRFPAQTRSEDPGEAKPAEKEAPIQVPATQDDSLLSESLAKIYIKQGKYAKAHEIISNLSLKYPEKSIYFADQLRFLQKLVINQKYIKQQ